MLFNSPHFVLLVAVTALLFYTPRLVRFQVSILIASSVVFYAYGQPMLLALLIASALTNGLCSYRVLTGQHAMERKRWATLGVIANLCVLAFFKYNRLFAETLLGDLSQLEGVGHVLVTLPLPIGISFYTFQGISLLVDVLRGEGREEDSDAIRAGGLGAHLKRTLFFISFFPQLVAGPIVKAHEFYPQIRPKYLSEVPWEKVTHAIVLGYFLKVVVADNLQHQTFWMGYPFFEAASTLDLCVIVFGYSMQIFADFAGYSLIAIGVAGLYGYHLPDNFNFPYISQSFSEFWRRWHISLSTWLRTYLYVPLGGNRGGRYRTYRNLMLTMLLGGLWHGAAWSFVVWGALHGALLALERPFLGTRLFRSKHPAMVALRMLVVFVLVSLIWIPFHLTDFDHVVLFFEAMSSNTGHRPRLQLIFTVLFYSLPVIVYHALYWLGEREWTLSMRLRPALCGVLLFLIFTNPGDADAFIYFQF